MSSNTHLISSAERPFEWQSDTLSIKCARGPGTEFIKPFLFSTQLSMKFVLLINVKMPTIVGILTFISRINDSIS